jgi:Zn-dependent metalloprotease
MGSHPVCEVIPPHILRSIAERGDASARRDALAALELAAVFRGERLAISVIAGPPTLPSAKKRRVIFDARNSVELPGKRVRSEGAPRASDAAVNEAYESIGASLEFLRRACDRNSIDGAGLRIDATVHYGIRHDNALWNGRQLIYGDGDGRYFRRFTASIDVAAHELAHGMTQYTAALDYQGQSGALNEHFSDVFGILAKQYAGKQSASRASWIIGAGLFTRRVNGDGVRSMRAPGTAYDDPVLGRDPQPSHMKGYFKTRLDNGGVHINSGIPNHAFYQLATLLGGKAWDVPGRIWYRALTQMLRSKSTFQDCADATYESAAVLFGRGSAPHQAVLAAWKTVGISVSESIVRHGPRLRVKGADAFNPPAAGAEVSAEIPYLRV